LIASGNANITHNALSAENPPESRVVNLGLGTLRSVGGGVTLAQPLFRGFRTVAQTAQAEDLVCAETAHLTSVEQQVLLAATADYLEVLRLQAVVDVNAENEAFMQRLFDTTNLRYQRNNVSETDLSQVQAGLAEATASRLLAQGALSGARASFLRDTGRVAGTLEPPGRLPQAPPSQEAAIDSALADNPDVNSARFAAEAARENARVIHGGLLPSFDLEIRAGHNLDPAVSLQRLDTAAATVNLTIPLYDGGLVESQTREARQQWGVAKHQLDVAREQARQAVTFAWEQWQANHQAIGQFRTQVEANVRALDGEQKLVSAGLHIPRDAVLAEGLLFQARLNLAQAQHDEKLAIFTLVGVDGRLTARELKLPVEYFDPDRYLRAVRGASFSSLRTR
jgi:TolC family type I secretion outer membrane protein